jgi:hypothetical protein
MLDLWPEELASENLPVPPVTILKEQAIRLGEKTQNVVEAEVKNLAARLRPPDHPFGYTFSLVGSAIAYRYDLFLITHPVEMYPVKFVIDAAVEDELREAFGAEIKAHSQKEFEEVLKAIFAAEKTRVIISAIVAQSKAM